MLQKMGLQTLSLSFSQRLLRKVVAAAGIPQFRRARRCVAVYRQFRLAALTRRKRTDRHWHRDPAAKPQEGIEGIRLQKPPITIAESPQKGLDLPVRQWIGHHLWNQFHTEGYMVIRNVLPASMITDAVREIAAFVGADLADSATWYGGAPELDGVVPMHHAQSLWDIRQCPNLYQVFTEFFETPRLMVDINRCIFRPPSPSGLPDH